MSPSHSSNRIGRKASFNYCEHGNGKRNTDREYRCQFEAQGMNQPTTNDSRGIIHRHLKDTPEPNFLQMNQTPFDSKFAVGFKGPRLTIALALTSETSLSTAP